MQSTVDGDAVSVALEKEGMDAVDPLIECIATDNRLTLGVYQDNHDPSFNYLVIEVPTVAYEILCAIVQERNFGPETEEGWNRHHRDAIAAELRAYWKKYKGLSPAERRYRILADDASDPNRWSQAAAWIVQPTNEHLSLDEQWVVTDDLPPGQAPTMRGEALRGKKNPSVSDLMAKRATGPGHVDMALDLATWDIRAARPVLRAQIENLKAAESAVANEYQPQTLPSDMSKLFTALFKTGDPNAGREYAAWIHSEKVCDDPAGDEIFQPLWIQPDDPSIAAATDWLFNNAASPWRCLARLPGKSPFHPCTELLQSPLLGLPAFQKSVLRNLADQAPCRQFTVADSQVDIDGEGNWGSDVPIDPKLMTKPGEKRTMRVCDWYASGLANMEGAPEFEVYWPQEKRDAAIKQFIAFVNDWSDRFGWNATQATFYNVMIRQPARMVFPYRDRPATDAEAKAHTAIFSLGTAAPARIAPLPAFPAEANWTTLKRFLYYTGENDPKTGELVWTPNFDQHGWIWQAEERLENGKWKRYYGFVGNHIVAKVPSEEIELVKPATQP
jgi:hypothetical protein